MEKNKNDQRSQHSDSKSIEQSTEKNMISLQDKSSSIIEDAEEKKPETCFQRRPQFKLSENNRRRFF